MCALYLLNSLVIITHPLPLLRLRGPGFVRNRDLYINTKNIITLLF